MSSNPYYLSHGSHASPEDGRCAMEWVAFLAGEKHTDQPACVNPPLRLFCIRFNDVLGDEDRQRLRPYLARCIGTAGDGRTGERGYLCLDWIVRTYTPTWLELAGLAEDGARLRALAPITDLHTAKAAGPVVREARQKAAAAWVAAGDAAGAAAGAALAPTVKVLQASAFDLLDRMLPKVMLDVPAGIEQRVTEMEVSAG